VCTFGPKLGIDLQGGTRVTLTGIKWGTPIKGIKWARQPKGIKWGIKWGRNGTYQSAIVAGKSLATLATVGYWLLLGAPLVALSAGIRRDPAAGLVSAGVLIAVVAWSMGQLGLWLGVAIESDFIWPASGGRSTRCYFLNGASFSSHSSMSWINPSS